MSKRQEYLDILEGLEKCLAIVNTYSDQPDPPKQREMRMQFRKDLLSLISTTNDIIDEISDRTY